ncbi:MAG: hypothetical protein GWP60_02305 [Gammaproteobacteria bacterium]|nr:hypothetical protein [Gammaproteobacteria bacterium]
MPHAEYAVYAGADERRPHGAKCQRRPVSLSQRRQPGAVPLCQAVTRRTATLRARRSLKKRGAAHGRPSRCFAVKAILLNAPRSS